jgi:hypothetical protein
MGLIFTKTFIDNDEFNVNTICGFQNILESEIQESLICKSDKYDNIEEEEMEDPEGEIIENFEDEDNVYEEELEDPFLFEVSPFDYNMVFNNNAKKILKLTRFSISKNYYIILSNYLKVFNKKRIILFNNNYGHGDKLYNNLLNLEYPDINEVLPNTVTIYFSDWLVNFTWNYRTEAIISNPNMPILPLELQYLFGLNKDNTTKLNDFIDLKEIKARFFFLLDNLIESQNIIENYEEESENITEEELVITPLKYDFNNISIISEFYEDAVKLQNTPLEDEYVEDDLADDDLIENMEPENIIDEENIIEKDYYKPKHITEKPVTIIDKLDEMTNGNGQLTLIIIILIIVGILIYIIMNTGGKPVSKFVKPAGYMFTMPNPGYPPTGYMYPPVGYYPNYPAVYP